MNIRNELNRLVRLSVGELQAEYQRLYETPPRSNNRVFLIKRIAWRLQAIAEGGLSERALELAARLGRDVELRSRPRPEIHAAFTEISKARRGPIGIPPVGSLIIRPYKGRRLQVRVLESGFEFEGATYSSLSAVAKAATGSEWNGRLFFGLSERSTK
jgi:hypothetical protein